MGAFATAADLSAWLPPGQAESLGDDTDRILARASELVAEAATSGWPVDAQNLPALAEDRATLRDATLAQVEQWLEVGEENDIAGYSRATSMGPNGLSVSSLPAILAPRARRILRSAGLTGGRAY
ncbi:hypothetical protein [Blastococcus mobilis]|uniref:Head-to-tail adaptor n=1 Tax=Blastococcus mobilis TaxID=1938746 RepID=A0A238VFB6_9ACTN|nr:hypothetical protein [Blastococcus mobilis]SNR33080.1 hypothetical protein SAMN06272737_10388 [Blastococcus mobilis]